MDGEFRHRARSNDDLNSSLGKTLDKLFKSVLFALSVGEEFISVFEQDGSLSLSLLHLNVGVEDGNLSFLDRLDAGLDASYNDYTMNNLGVFDSTAKDLLDSDIVNVELSFVLRNSVDTSFSNKSREEVFQTKLL